MYFDPGMGSLIIQAIVAGLAVIGGYFGIVKGKFKGLFGGKKNTNANETGEEKSNLDQESSDDTL